MSAEKIYRTQEEIDQLAVEYYSSGRKVECEYFHPTFKIWLRPVESPSFLCNLAWRKVPAPPQPKMVELNFNDISPTDLFKKAIEGDDKWFSINSADKEGVLFNTRLGIAFWTYKELREIALRSTTGPKGPWLKCEKEER